MKRRRCLVIGCTLAVLAGLLGSPAAPATLALVPASERYRLALFDAQGAPSPVQSPHQAVSGESENYHLAASEIGNVPAAMGSSSYGVNRGMALQAEVAPPMGSENYRVGGVIPLRVYLPLVLRG